MKSRFSYSVFFLFIAQMCIAQGTVQGTIIDSKTSEPLAYASIHIPSSLKGTVSDENGMFQLQMAKNEDTIIVSYIGFQDKRIVIEDYKKKLNIALNSSDVQLQEIVVRSMTPLDYLRAAIKKYPSTIDSSTFEARGYFQEKAVLANDASGSFKVNEAVFTSYFTQFGDTSEVVQNRLALFREKEEGTFRTILLDNKKLKKRAGKEKGEDGEREALTQEELEEDVDFDIDGFLGIGPEAVLDDAQTILTLDFLKEKYFSKIKYSFGPNTEYLNRQLFNIKFEAKRKINHSRYSGSIYLDVDDLAIVAIEYDQIFKIPFWANLILKGIIGIGITDVQHSVSIRNQNQNNYWYPKELIKDLKIAYKQKERTEAIKIKMLYSIDQILSEGIQSVPKEIRYTAEKEYQEQVYKIEGLDWDNVNVVNY